MLLENLLWKKFQNFIAEAAEVFLPYFEVLPDGFVKRPCNVDLVFWSWVSHIRMNTFKKTERELLKKYLRINQQLQKEIRSRNLIILNFANTGYVRASKEVKLIICKTFFCSKFMWYLEFRFSSDSDLQFRLPFRLESLLVFCK